MRNCAPLAQTSRYVILLLITAMVVGCASRRHDVARDSFTTHQPFSKTIAGSGDAVCWSVKRALLSQGYMLDRPGESGVLTGTRDYQPEPKLNVTVHLQTTCADNRDGTSIVFVTASREDSPRANDEADDERRHWSGDGYANRPAPPKFSGSCGARRFRIRGSTIASSRSSRSMLPRSRGRRPDDRRTAQDRPTEQSDPLMRV